MRGRWLGKLNLYNARMLIIIWRHISWKVKVFYSVRLQLDGARVVSFRVIDYGSLSLTWIWYGYPLSHVWRCHGYCSLLWIDSASGYVHLCCGGCCGPSLCGGYKLSCGRSTFRMSILTFWIWRHNRNGCVRFILHLPNGTEITVLDCWPGLLLTANDWPATVTGMAIFWIWPACVGIVTRTGNEYMNGVDSETVLSSVTRCTLNKPRENKVWEKCPDYFSVAISASGYSH